MNNTSIPALRLPNAKTLFQQRAVRLRGLAETSLAGYMDLMADLALIQQDLAESFNPGLIPDEATGRPPLEISSWPRDPVWRQHLRIITQRLNPVTGPLDGILDRIGKAADSEMETWANWLLAGRFDLIAPETALFVAAALQVHWVTLAACLEADTIRPPQTAYLCPVCDSLPVAGVLQTGGAVQGLRYLSCALCGSEWNRPRIHCLNCGSSKDVAYYGIAGTNQVVQAEACGECKTYLKLLNRDKDPALDPFADDLASLALDLMMDEEGYQRLGFNPMLIAG